MTQRVEAIVIGGGVIGTSVFYHLAKSGKETVLLEREDILSGTAGASDGFVIMQTKKPGIHLRIGLASRERFQTLAEELGMDVGYVKNGGYFLAQNQEELDYLAQLVEQQRQGGLDVSLLDAATLQKQEPQVSKGLIGASYSPSDGMANPLKLARAFVKAARNKGGVLHTETEVQGFIVENGKMKGVKTSKGEFLSDTVVICCGAWTPVLGEMLGLKIPIFPRLGQCLVTEPTAPFINGVMLCGSYFVKKHQVKFENGRPAGNPGDLNLTFAIEQTQEGTMLLTNTREWRGYDRTNTQEGIEAIMRNAIRYLPEMKKLHIIRCFAGLRPFTPDSLPILGPVEGLEGLYLAAGHEGDGIALAAITGQLLAEEITEGAASIPLTDFNLSRFRP